MSTYTPSLGLELIAPGSQAGLWGNTTNNSLNLIDQAITGVTPISFAAASGSVYTLTDYNGSQDEARSAVLNVTGAASGTNTIIIPNKQKTYYVRNATGKEIVVRTAVGTTPCSVGKDYNLPVFCDGNNNVYLAILAPGAGTLTVTGGGTGVTTFSAGFIKSAGGTSSLSSSSTVSLATEVSGILDVSKGGTGRSTLPAGGLLFGAGTGAVGSFVGGATGQVATWNGSEWIAQAPATGGVSTISGTAPINVTAGSNPVVSLNASGVVAGSYTNSNVTVDTFGRITAIQNGTAGSAITSIAAGQGILVNGGTGPVTSGAITIAATGGGMIYPASGIPFSNATSWGTSYNGANPIPVGYGGTGTTSFTNGALLKGNGTSSLSTATSTDIVNAIGTTEVNNASKLGSFAASNYARYAVAGSWSAAQTTNNLGNGTQGWIVTSGGLTSGLSNNAVQLGYIGVGVYAPASNIISMFTGTAGWTIQGTTATFNGAGGCFKPGGGPWADSSDARLKENIIPLTGALDKIASLNPVSYEWRYDRQNISNVGFVAQEVESVFPNAVTKTEPTEEQKPFIPEGEMVKNVGWQNDIFAYLVGAIQELKSEVDALKAAR